MQPNFLYPHRFSYLAYILALIITGSHPSENLVESLMHCQGYDDDLVARTVYSYYPTL